MKKILNLKREIAFLTLILLSVTIYAQEIIYMPYFTISGMHSDYKISSTKMLKTYIESTNKYQVLLSKNIDSSSIDISISQTQREAIDNSANYFIIGDLNAVGNLLIISVKMFETSSAKLIWNDVIKANSLSDLDPSMQKIANTIGTSNKANSDNDISNVTDYESAANKTIFAQSKNCISVEGGFISSSAVDVPFIYGLGYSRMFDVKKFIFCINGNYLWGDARYFRMDVGLIYPLTKKYTTPYVGGGLGLSSTGTKQLIVSSYSSYNDWKSKGGLELMVNGGILLMRNASVGMKIGANVSFPTYMIGNNYSPISRINVGICF